jgi:hypothetical protein
MHRLRQIAFVILFAGWMLPAVLAQKARERATAGAPAPRSPVELITGIEPPPLPGDRVVSIFRAIAGLWFLIALIYAGVLTIRLRRTIVG